MLRGAMTRDDPWEWVSDVPPGHGYPEQPSRKRHGAREALYRGKLRAGPSSLSPRSPRPGARSPREGRQADGQKARRAEPEERQGEHPQARPAPDPPGVPGMDGPDGESAQRDGNHQHRHRAQAVHLDKGRRQPADLGGGLAGRRRRHLHAPVGRSDSEVYPGGHGQAESQPRRDAGRPGRSHRKDRPGAKVKGARRLAGPLFPSPEKLSATGCSPRPLCRPPSARAIPPAGAGPRPGTRRSLSDSACGTRTPGAGPTGSGRRPRG